MRRQGTRATSLMKEGASPKWYDATEAPVLVS